MTGSHGPAAASGPGRTAEGRTSGSAAISSSAPHTTAIALTRARAPVGVESGASIPRPRLPLTAWSPAASHSASAGRLSHAQRGSCSRRSSAPRAQAQKPAANSSRPAAAANRDGQPISANPAAHSSAPPRAGSNPGSRDGRAVMSVVQVVGVAHPRRARPVLTVRSAPQGEGRRQHGGEQHRAARVVNHEHLGLAGGALQHLEPEPERAEGDARAAHVPVEHEVDEPEHQQQGSVRGAPRFLGRERLARDRGDQESEQRHAEQEAHGAGFEHPVPGGERAAGGALGPAGAPGDQQPQGAPGDREPRRDAQLLGERDGEGDADGREPHDPDSGPQRGDEQKDRGRQQPQEVGKRELGPAVEELHASLLDFGILGARALRGARRVSVGAYCVGLAARYLASAARITDRIPLALPDSRRLLRTDSSLSSREMLASTLTWGVPVFSGETSRMKSVAGSPSAASKSSPWAETAQAPIMRSTARALPCGIATPFPIPVDMMASRRSTRSRISPWLLIPWAASIRATSSATASRLLVALRRGLTAAGTSSSESSIAGALQVSNVRRHNGLYPREGQRRVSSGFRPEPRIFARSKRRECPSRAKSRHIVAARGVRCSSPLHWPSTGRMPRMLRTRISLVIAGLTLGAALSFAEPDFILRYPSGVPQVSITGDYAGSHYTVWRQPAAGGQPVVIGERSILCL